MPSQRLPSDHRQTSFPACIGRAAQWMAVWGASATLLGAPAVTFLSETQFSSTGGETLLIQGSGMSSVTQVLVRRLGGAEAEMTQLQVIDSRRVQGVMPALPAGVYDLLIQWSGSPVLVPAAVTLGAEQYPPPLEIEAYRVGNTVTIQWGSIVNYDTVQALRMPGQQLLTQLPGERTIVDNVTGISADQPITYTIYGIANGHASRASQVVVPRFSAAYPCLDVLETMTPFLNLPSLHSTRYLTLFGQEENEVRGCFRTDAAISGGVTVRFQIRRNMLFPSQVVAQLLEAGSRTILDTQTVADVALGEGLATRQLVYANNLPAGNYVLRLKVQGGSADMQVYSGVASDEESLPEPFPCAPYAALEIVPNTCGQAPPTVQIQRYSATAFSTDKALGPGRYQLPNPQLSPQIEPKPILLEGVATPAGGATISRYVWTVAYRAMMTDPETFLNQSSFGSIMAFFLQGEGLIDVYLTVIDSNGMEASASRSFLVYPDCSNVASNEPPAVCLLDPVPSTKHFLVGIPHIVEQEFRVLVDSGAGRLTNSVQMSIYSDGHTVLGPVQAMPDFTGTPKTYWRAAFNMSQIPADFRTFDEWFEGSDYLLAVTASDGVNPVGGLVAGGRLCRPLGCDNGTLDALNASYAYNSTNHTYSVTMAFPGDDNLVPSPYRSWHLGSPINHTFKNSLVANMQTRALLSNGQWSAGPLEGHLGLKLLDLNLVDKDLGPWPPDVESCCPDMELSWDIPCIEPPDIHETFQESFWIFHNQTIANVWGINIELDLGVGACYDTCLKPDLSLSSDECITLSACLIPDADFVIRAKIKARALVLTIGGGIEPSINLTLPTNFSASFGDGGGLDFDVAMALALSANLYYFVEACIDWFFDKSCLTVFDGDIDLGCVGNACDGGGCNAGCGQCGEDCHPFAARQSCDEELLFPTVSVSPDGLRTLKVWIDKSGNAADPDLYFSVEEDDAWSADAPIYATDDHNNRDPQVAFISNTQALLVWVRNSLTHAQTQALQNDNVDDLNAYFAGDEIVYALYDVNTGWSAPGALTSNNYCDGTPKIAAATGAVARRAYVTWMGFDGAPTHFLNPDGEPEFDRSASWVHVRRLDSTGPVGADTVMPKAGLSDVDACDFEPAITVNAQGTEGNLVFVRERLPATRVMMRSRFNGLNWLAPTVLLSNEDSARIDQLSIAQGAGGQALAAYVQRPERPDAPELTANRLVLTSEDDVHFVLMDSVGLVDIPHRVSFQGRCCGLLCAAAHLQDIGNERRDFKGVWPQTIHMGGNEFIIGIQAFNGLGGSFDGGTELAIASVNAAVTPLLYAVQVMTDDADPNYEAAFARLSSAAIRTVTTRCEGGGHTRAVPRDLSLRPDIQVGPLRNTNRYPRPGELLTVSIPIRNAGLARINASPAVSMQIGFFDGTTFTPVLVESNIGLGLGIGASTTLRRSIQAPAGATRLRVVLSGAANETHLDNNTSETPLGVQPPTDFACETVRDATEPSMRLRWTNTDRYDAIVLYRNDLRIAELPGWAVSYVESRIPDGTHTWAVRGRIGSTLSQRRAASCTARSRGVVFVRAAAGGANDGTSWEDAFTSLAAALNVARSDSAVTQIWVAAGIYKPGTAGASRDTSFALADRVGVFGGFSGTESARWQRDTTANVTTLSGDRQSNDGLGIFTDNFYHVVTATGLDPATVLDGFTIRAGNADQTASPNNNGAGIRISGGGLTVRNCLITANRAQQAAGIACLTGAAKLQNCTLFENLATGNSGAIFLDHGGPHRLDSCRVVANSSGGTGGGVYIDTCPATLVDCVLDANSSVGNGAALYNRSGQVNLLNCVLTRNESDGTGGGVYTGFSSASFAASNCLFAGNTADGSAAMHLFTGAAALTNCTIVHNQTPDTSTAGVRLQSGTLTIANSILYYNSSNGVQNEAAQLGPAAISARYSCIQGLVGNFGPGNIGATPQFRNPGGWVSESVFTLGNYHLLPISLCIDAGDSGALPPDEADLDRDGDALEPLPLDFDRRPRRVNAPHRVDTGLGPPVVDMGVLEALATGDMNCDGAVTVSDIAGFVHALTNPSLYASLFPGCNRDHADINGDGAVTVSDIGPFVQLLTSS